MSKWEDIVKDRLEEAEDALPESVLAEFRARRDAAAPVSGSRRFPLAWVLATVAAAGLSAVFLLRQPAVPEGGDRDVPPSAETPVLAIDTPDTVESDTGKPEPVVAAPLVAQALTPKVNHSYAGADPALTPAAEAQEEAPGVVEQQPEAEEMAAPEEKATPDIPETEPADEAVLTPLSPFVPEGTVAGPVKMGVGPKVGIIAGSGLLVTALAAPLLGGYAAPSSMPQTGVLPSDPPASEPQEQDKICGIKHAFPFRAGVSLGIPVAEKLRISTGLEYSSYSSRISYSLSGEKRQTAHYLGIPVRLDWIFASGKWLDAYVGGGFELDSCIGATLAAKSIPKDGFGLSLLGAGGLQLNLTDRIGLYVEPEISWTIPSEKRVLHTYRSENPLMFSVTGGIRFNLGK